MPDYRTVQIQRIFADAFQPQIPPTIGAVFTPVLIDTPDGQQKFRGLVPLCSRSATLAFVASGINPRTPTSGSELPRGGDRQ
jgi:hypothetical protein